MAGLGTLILGMKNLNLYEFFLSIIQFCFCYPFVSKAVEIKKIKNLIHLKLIRFCGYIYYVSRLSFI
jgi:hypothetical protein